MVTSFVQKGACLLLQCKIGSIKHQKALIWTFKQVEFMQYGIKSAQFLTLQSFTGHQYKNKVDLSTYIVVPYMSPHIGISSDKLVEETTEYFRNYNLNGLTGTLTIFGDFGLPPAVQVELIDYRNPSKNGVYLVEEVTTNFGVGGYRQTLSIPYKIKKLE